jgi:hypothetical protein
MAFAPAPPPLMPMQFATGPSLGDQLQALAKAGTPIARAAGQAIAPGAPPPPSAPGSAVPGATGMTAVGGPTGPQPLVAPGTTPAGPAAPGAGPGMAGMPSVAAPQPSIVEAIRGMAPQQILDALRAMSQGGQRVIPPGMPGSTALQGAGMMPSTYGG